MCREIISLDTKIKKKGETMKAKKILTLVATILFVALVTMPLWANHVVVEDVSLTDQNTTLHYANIKFDISWENSWRLDGVAAPNNWDAAWVFAKWKLHSGTDWDWAHCTLNTSGHSAPTGSVVENPTSDNPQTGVFIYRSEDNKTTAGNAASVDWNNVKLRWNYGDDGVSDDAIVDVKVFAIEMAYITEGSFYIGDGSSIDRFYDGSNNIQPFNVTDSPIEFGQSAGQLWALGSWDSPSGSLQAEYPTGYSSFYCMKYEISQGQYADFLSLLTDDQNDNRYPNFNGNNRHTISGTYGNYTASCPDRACNYISWADGAAYSDWAGLRPMTELEFEKICRGTLNAVNNEYAWGNANIANYAYTLSNDGSYNATVSNAASDPTGNAFYGETHGDIDGPLRCGIFATSTSTRAEAGASYYGIMEMSGNLEERVVPLGRSSARNFTGIHGNGVLDSNGNANVSTWPGPYPKPSGCAYRGRSWIHDITDLRVSNRHGANSNSPTSRYNREGFRSVRTQ